MSPTGLPPADPRLAPTWTAAGSERAGWELMPGNAAASRPRGAAPGRFDQFVARSRTGTPDALAGMSRYDCVSPQDEGATIALLLRRTLETPGMTAALVTPDRELARRVAAELRRWDIEIDNSAGVPLGRTPPGVFLRLVLDLAASALAPVPLLAALKHPLAAGGLAPRRFASAPGVSKRRSADRVRRPVSPGCGRRWPAREQPRASAAVCRSSRNLPRRSRRLIEAEAAPLAELVSAHVAAAERLAATDDGDRHRASVARRGRRGGGAVLSRADRRGRRFPAAAAGGTTRRCSRRWRPARSCARLTAAIRAWRSGAWSKRGCSRPICWCSAG